MLKVKGKNRILISVYHINQDLIRRRRRIWKRDSPSLEGGPIGAGEGAVMLCPRLNSKSANMMKPIIGSANDLAEFILYIIGRNRVVFQRGAKKSELLGRWRGGKVEGMGEMGNGGWWKDGGKCGRP